MIGGRSRAWLTLVLLTAFALLVLLRMPEIPLKGRFWAEEGKYFFASAWNLPPLRALFMPVGGYLNIVANAATLAARWAMPLQLAPYATIAVALGVQLLPPWLLLTARDAWLRPPVVRMAGVALLLFVPASEEIWLQTLHCQFELTLCCAMILAFDASRGAGAIVRLPILFLAPLSGPGAIALLPLFLLRVAADRTVARLLQMLALGTGAALQILLFLGHAATRAYAFDPGTLLCVLTVRHLALPFLGQHSADSLAAAVRMRLAAGHLPIRASLLPVLAFGTPGVAALGRSSRGALWLLSAGLLVAFVSYFGAIGKPTDLIDTRFGERYAFVPEALFGLTLLALAATGARPISSAAWALVAWQIAMGAILFFHPWPLVADGPAWRPAVAAWRSDPARSLPLWPDGWSMRLPAHQASSGREPEPAG